MDQILHGGFPVNSINIIMGQPGTGKTIFAEQMVFHHANQEERPILYLTTLSEPLAKVLTYLQRFSFYDEEKINSTVIYQDMGAELAENGISALIPSIEESIHSLSPKMIVIDSFKALHDLSESPEEIRRTLHKLTGLLTAFETTVFLLGEYTDEHCKTLPEFAMVDGIVQFLRSTQSTRDERFVRVLKLRGNGYSEGLHGCCITESGVEIYPRLVTPHIPEDYVLKDERVPSGIDGLDPIIGGGFLKGSSTLLLGPTGAGKTTFALQFAMAALANKNEGNALIINFQENPTQLARSIRHLTGSNEKPAGLELMYISPVEIQVDSVIVSLFNRIEKEKFARIAVDSIGDLAIAASDSDRLHDYLYALVQHFAVRGVTSLMTSESFYPLTEQGSLEARMDRISYMSDNIIMLNLIHDPNPRRQLRCAKARGTSHDLRAHDFRLTTDGMHVGES